jgi:hypothetical protein
MRQDIHMSSVLQKLGLFYPRFLESKPDFYSEQDRGCMENTVRKLITQETTGNRPGMLLGKIQSGKTKTFLGITALAFDNGYDIAIVLTKGTRALASQTLQRVKADFRIFTEAEEILQIHDIMQLPPDLSGFELNQKWVIVAKKQEDNLRRVIELFQVRHPELALKKVLVIDDEADFASVGFRAKKEESLTANVTMRQIDEIRTAAPKSSFLQVTATPYALYLQPEEGIRLEERSFKPVKPAFTELVPTHPKYIGSAHYFETSQNTDHVAAHLYEPVTVEELKILQKPDGRRLKLDGVLNTPETFKLRDALCNFIVGGCIRRFQQKQAGLAVEKFSFLVHTEAAKLAHGWQRDLVVELYTRLREASRESSPRFDTMFRAAFGNLATSLRIHGDRIPNEDAIRAAVQEALAQDHLKIVTVNSEKELPALLDERGELRRATPLNIFIGGQILDRGITIANLIGFYYGRRPNVSQQDTVLQHSRMYGYRPPEDLAVTRFYTAPAIYAAMRRIHEFDQALRERIEQGPGHDEALFIQRGEDGKVVPCSPNKIRMSKVLTFKPWARHLPVGFQTDFKTRMEPALRELESLMRPYLHPENEEAAVLIPVEAAAAMLAKIKPTLLLEEGYDFDWDDAAELLRQMSNSSKNSAQQGKVWLLLRRGRDLSRFKANQVFSNAPDTARTDTAVAKEAAKDVPMLMLIQQKGLDERGWRGTPFFWPVIVAHENCPTIVWSAGKQKQLDAEDEDGSDVTP